MEAVIIIGAAVAIGAVMMIVMRIRGRKGDDD